jgi:hypothetical protein
MAPSGSVKSVYVGRHRLLPAQQEALNELKLCVVKQIENLPMDAGELNALLRQLRNEGIEAVVTIALPPHLLAQLSATFPLYVFEMKSSTVPTVEDAQRWVQEDPGSRTYLPGRPGEAIRVLQFTGVNRVRVTIQSEKVWPVQ